MKNFFCKNVPDPAAQHSSNGAIAKYTVCTEQSVRHIDPKFIFNIVASSKDQRRETKLPQTDLTDHSRHDFINSWVQYKHYGHHHMFIFYLKNFSELWLIESLNWKIRHLMWIPFLVSVLVFGRFLKTSVRTLFLMALKSVTGI